jgi:lipopolysaccharide/colanic/teichoic acid biosynthesis glycosyltransferase
MSPAIRVERPSIGWYRYGPITSRVKRLIDITVASCLVIVLSPLMAAIALVIRLTSSGPAVFRQTRAGFAEQPFTILKFRTMAADNDPADHQAYVTSMLDGSLAPGQSEDGVYKLVDDPRITRIGAWLRRTSLDELPQLFNVIRGEMSLVGPRPSLYYEVENYADHHRLRSTSLPGMTGLWQVEGRSDLHMLEALDLDLTYVQTCSLRSDMKILFRTVGVFTNGRAA